MMGNVRGVHSMDDFRETRPNPGAICPESMETAHVGANRRTRLRQYFGRIRRELGNILDFPEEQRPNLAQYRSKSERLHYADQKHSSICNERYPLRQVTLHITRRLERHSQGFEQEGNVRPE
jgi:hypothetical protein